VHPNRCRDKLDTSEEESPSFLPFFLIIIPFGFRAKETDLLQKDTEDMEARLAMLQEKMRQQEAESAKSSAKAGGQATWGSARLDKGSVGTYGKEVKDKFKKQLDSTVSKDSLLRGTASARRLLQTTDSDFRSKGKWKQH
jgi:hypothetical protein